jgi:hypothetical protein
MRQTIRALSVLGALAGAVAALSCSNSSAPNGPDPNAVAFSFAVFGCNRVAAADTLGNPSTANVPQLNQSFADIAALSPRPKFLFFVGDEVLGYAADTNLLAKQLTAWRALYEASPLATAGVELVAIPGNHEVEGANHLANAALERTWLRVMAPYVSRGGNGPAAGGPDNLQTDQSHLSYSFDFQDAHFLALDSDPTGKDFHVPASWVQSDVAAAKSRGVKHIFAFAHKPAYPYPTVATDGLSQDTASRNAFWAALQSGQAEAMFSAHNHVFYRSQPTNGKTWMVIAGGGGSSLEPTIDPSIPTTGAYFGFTLVSVTNSGRVIARTYGRPVPAGGYTSSTGVTPATLRDSTEITWK